MEDKRKHKRLELTGEILIKELGAAGDGETADIAIHDCSRDGIGFTTDKVLTVGSNYEANLTLWNKDKIHVFIQIVRADKEGDIFRYGGIFIGMPDADQMRIQVYETVTDELEHQGH
jgi:hypothetical protein